MSAAPQTAEAADRLRMARRWVADRPLIVLCGILLLLILASDIVSPGFVTARQLSSALLIAAPLGMLAAGQTLVMLTGGIDLSVATTATLAAYALAELGGSGTPLSIAAALGVGLVAGLANGIGIGIFGVQPLIMTLGLSGIIIGLQDVATLAFTQSQPLIPDFVHQLGSGTMPGLSLVPWSLLLWAPLAALIVLGLRRSGLGRMVYAVGDNPLACRLAGVRVWQVLLATYTLCGLLSALAGILLVGYTNASDPALGIPYLLPSVAAVVIGGTSILGGSGGYAGTILGAIILTELDSLLTLLNASESLRQMLYGVIILALAWVYARTAGSE